VDNTISGHRDGIYFEFVKHSRIARNLSERNLRYGLHFMFSDSCQYLTNTFRDNGAGVAVMYTHFVTMRDNDFVHNVGPSSYGLLLKEISDSEVHSNRIRSNSTGIYLEGCNRVAVTHNDITDNGWGVLLMANSMDSRFVRNNFTGNSFHVATNSRQNFSTFAENYWSDYQGYDLDRDGFGDIPFRPVTLFSMVVQQNPPTLILLHSLVIGVTNLVERLMPHLTPQNLVDERPAMEPLP
jgi:nitrous oxidase accessory protein